MKAMGIAIIPWIQRRKEFKFLASVKLAVPLMLAVAAAVAWGTIVESKYNAEMAKITVYNADWFSVLMLLLWVNIFCATLARYPFKKHHTGFVITHIGLLMLLAGGVVTTQYGIDGTLAVSEGQSDNMVSLPKLVFGIAPEGSMNFQTVEIPRSLSETDKFYGHNKAIGHIAEIKKYLPFASVNSTFVSQADSPDYALSFKLKSPFFDVSEFLHTRLSPRKQMGPALFELKVGQPDGQAPITQAKVKPAKKSEGLIRVLAASSGETVHEVPLSKFKQAKKFKFRDFEVELQQIFVSATVAGNKIAESGDSKPNPAVELNVRFKGKNYREVLFARFPNFSLSREPASEYKLQFVAGEAPAQEVSAEPIDGQGHLARFFVDPAKPEVAQLELFKNNQKVLSQEMKPGQTVQTPWMGMQVTLASVVPNAVEANDVMAVEPQQREDIPPGALEILPRGGSQTQWITEGETKDIEANGRRYSVYFGRKMFRLPFQLNLQKFYKKDYPGTQTAMSFESDVTVSASSQVHKISMNEPLYLKGYTLYQASYQLNPGAPAISVFSVNYDPGRQTKYLGSLILCLGIVIFVIQRSSFYRNRQKRVEA